MSFKKLYYLLMLFSLHTAYADDADTQCALINAKAVRQLPVFMTQSVIGCDALPQQSTNIDKLCASLIPTKILEKNCGASYYLTTMVPSDKSSTVLQCSGIPTSGPGKVVFKYVLCQKDPKLNGPYIWAILYNNIGATLPPAILQAK